MCVTFWLALVASGVYSIWGTLTRNMYLIWLLFVYILCVFEKDMVDKIAESNERLSVAATRTIGPISTMLFCDCSLHFNLTI